MLYVIGIGTNLGNKIANIKNAIKLISEKLDVIKISNLYKSEALLKPEHPKEWDISFLNMALLIKFNAEPEELLEILKLIELKMGRNKNSPTWSPRVIDLDILIAENLTIDLSNLQIPHMDFFNRDFALIPAAEIAPDIIYQQKTLKEHCKKFKKN
jgi:2-amino-4-hydroxy-6-hydroxymethyldihydropteridine diphosphokinase/dihydropteroate synthase